MTEQVYRNKKLIALIINNISSSITLFLWCHRESNQGHTDFQSVALPTELWHLNFGLQIYISKRLKQNFNQI